MRISDWSSDVCSSDRRNCFRKRTSFSENSRRSDTWYFRLVIRSIPIPNAKPEKNCGSTPHFSSTFGSTIPQPRISTQPVCLQIVQPAPLQIVQDISISAEGSVNRSEENTSELQSLMRISYAVLC